MNSPKLTLVLLCALFLFISVIHFKIADLEEKDPYSLQAFTGKSERNGRFSGENNSYKKKSRKKQKKISINDASIEDIKSVSGFGEKMSEKVIEAREKAGGELTEEDILNISGIGESKLIALKERFRIPPTHADSKITPLNKQCPHCNKDLSSHDRKKHENYIYCPHCLKYLKKNKK